MEGWKAGKLEVDGWKARDWSWRTGAGRLESLRAGRLEGLRAGVLECWRAGRLESWKAGGLEGWQAGRLEGWLGITYSNFRI